MSGSHPGPTTRLDRLPTTIGAPATRGLAAAGFSELRQLVGVPAAELAGLHGVGPKAVRIIREELQAITRHHDEGEVVYVDARPTDYELRVVEPDATWPQQYDELAAAVARALGDRVVEIHHVGSTAVPGLPAKPIIDVDLVVADPADEAAYVPDLQALGLVHWLTEPDWHQHRLLKRLAQDDDEDGHEPRVHLHVFGPGCPEVVRHLMFRDWLRAHPEDRDRYAAAKREALAALDATGAEHGALGSGMRYNAFKEPVVRELYDAMFRTAGLLD